MDWEHFNVWSIRMGLSKYTRSRLQQLSLLTYLQEDFDKKAAEDLIYLAEKNELMSLNGHYDPAMVRATALVIRSGGTPNQFVPAEMPIQYPQYQQQYPQPNPQQPIINVFIQQAASPQVIEEEEEEEEGNWLSETPGIVWALVALMIIGALVFFIVGPTQVLQYLQPLIAAGKSLLALIGY